MDPATTSALIGLAGATVGAVLTGPIVASLFGRRLRAAQTAQAEAAAEQSRAQAEQLEALTDQIRHEMTTKIIETLRTELEHVQGALRATSMEAEQLRRRVLDLESRLAHLTNSEAQLSRELEKTQAERDGLRTKLAAAAATIDELRARVSDLQLQVASRAGGPAPA